jgi:hypothetical protein
VLPSHSRGSLRRAGDDELDRFSDTIISFRRVSPRDTEDFGPTIGQPQPRLIGHRTQTFCLFSDPLSSVFGPLFQPFDWPAPSTPFPPPVWQSPRPWVSTKPHRSSLLYCSERFDDHIYLVLTLLTGF